MESLAYIYFLIVVLVAVEIGGLALRFSALRRAPKFCSVWPFISVGLTLAVIVVSAFELYFIGISSLFGVFLILGPVVICVAISWISVANIVKKSE